MNKTEKQSEQKPRFKKWLKELGSILVIVAVVSFAMDMYYSSSMPSGYAPSIEATTIEGLTIDVNELSKDEPVIVYFWATWCGACKFVSPTINYFAEDHQVVTVALSSGNDQRIQQFLKAKEYQFNVVNDRTGQFSREWNISVTPTIVIIRDGEIKSISTGVISPVGLWIRTLFA